MSGPSEARALRLPDGSLAPLPLDRPLIVGSDPGEGGLKLDGPGVSGRHLAVARLKSGGFGCKVIDAQATTQLEGQPVRQARLELGQTLTVGELPLVLVDPSVKPKAAPPKKASKAHDGPERVGGFRVDRLIGRGSMGRVFLSVQESLDRQVALKLLRPELASDAAFVQRFQAEARAAAALSHPNVVTVFDVGEADGHHYLALEYMERGNLEERLAKDGPLPWRAVLGILRDAVAGLEYAEQKGLVHRDVKPANLMQNAAGATKLVDLGLATSVETTGDSDGVIRGTPHFMSPEQARGAPLDIRSDLFSLGATGYRLLTGKTPFEGDSSKAILRAVVQEQPKPVESLVPDVPRALQGFLDELMRKEPSERPATAAAARSRAEALMAELGSGPVQGGSSGRRAAALLAVLLIAAVGVALPFVLGGDDAPADGSLGDPSALAQSTAGASSDGPPTDGPPTDGASISEPSAESTDPVTPLETSAVTDGDAVLEALELEAERALAEARLLTDPTERVAALRDVADRYLGTDAAELAALQASQVDREEAAEAQAEDRAVAASVDLSTYIAQASLDPNGELLPPQLAFHALSTLAVPEGTADTADFDRMRIERELELELELRRRSDERLESADKALVDGRLDVAAREYRLLLDWLEALPEELEQRLAEPTDGAGQVIEDELDLDQLPTDRAGVLALLEQDEALDEVYQWRLSGRIALAQARLEALDGGWHERYRVAMEQSDQRAIADRLRESSFEGALQNFDLSAAAQTASSLANELRSELHQDSLRRLAGRLTRARAAFELLATEWQAGGWRRETAPVPGAEQETGTTVGVAKSGLVLQTDDGGLDVPWPAFALDTEGLVDLFGNRLKRDYTAAEREAIADLIGFAAINVALGRIEPVFDPNRRARLSPLEAEQIEAGFERALGFLGAGASGGALSADARASRHLRVGLLAVDEEDWTTAAHAFDRMLADSGTALFTYLLSDGSPRGTPTSWPPTLDPPPLWTPPDAEQLGTAGPSSEAEGSADQGDSRPSSAIGIGGGKDEGQRR
ncbi:MAG: FHA domain-containing serine/threonine-protein kinase [Planctomycetota bacterium]